MPAKKLIIAERAKYFKMVQSTDNVADFVTKLRKAAETCDFESLKSATSVCDELILSQLIVELNDSHIRTKAIEANQIMAMTLPETMEFIYNGRDKLVVSALRMTLLRQLLLAKKFSMLKTRTDM